ncbi:hypothetical protein TWF569_001102 [Orbilia oligospora]|nr:hypothetical protein TWF103_011684 [Orbilia oligospora]KAF3124955.1 hypothetical protein TWF569_001102 [Orbilia oligospora]KAF3143195.1 hypothetical protein TWF594_005258 [Orbilia oligospora]
MSVHAPDTAWSASSYYNHHTHNHHHRSGGSTPPPPPPPKDAPLTPPSSAFDSPSLKVSNYEEEDEGDDFQRYLAQSYREQEDEYRPPSEEEEDKNNGHSLHRAASIYSLSRTSFAAQLSRLTSLSMPLGTDLRSEITSLPSAKAGVDKLDSAYSQMQRWMQTAKTVLQGMDASDDVEWAAEGKKSLGDVESAMRSFEGLVKVYVDSIESIQDRPDINTVEPPSLKSVIDQMDITVKQWKEVQDLLHGVKAQVETAMEWTELWNSIMNDIQAELDACINCVFECEEKRNRVHTQENLDIDKLASIVEGEKQNNKISPEREDMSTALLGLFARMQPLRASLDFLPMRIQQFQYRAEEVFPTACEDLEMRREQLEKKWKNLEKDADVLKKELGEDKWVAIFRNAGKQASNMMESVERSIFKVKVRTQDASNITTDGSLLKLVENYETKRTHYGSAIERVLGIVNKGMQDRLTVNGEIIRLHTDLQAHWKNIEQEMQDLDTRLASIDLSQPQDMLPTPVSTSASHFADELSSNGSVGSTGRAAGQNTKRHSIVMTPSANSRLPRLRSISGASSLKTQIPVPNSPISPNTASPNPASRRLSVLPVLNTPKPPNPSILSPTTSRGSSPSLTSRRLSYQTPPNRPTLSRKPSNPGSNDGRPRWNGSTNTSGNGFGHNFKPITVTQPSPYRMDTGIPSPSKLPRSGDMSPLTTRPTPSSSRKYPPTSMRSQPSHDSIGSVGSGGRTSRNDNGSAFSKAYSHVKSSGYGRPSSALGKNNSPSKIPTLTTSMPSARSGTPEPPMSARTPASKRFSMPPISKKPGSVDLRPGWK